MSGFAFIFTTPFRPWAGGSAEQSLRRHSTAEFREQRRHWHMLLIALCVIAASFMLRVHGDGVALWFLPNFPLPQSCATRAWFGISCPGCGLTRSFVYLAHGQWRAAYTMHRLGWLLAVMLILQIPYRILCLCRNCTLSAAEGHLISGVVIFLLLFNWVVEQFGVLPGA